MLGRFAAIRTTNALQARITSRHATPIHARSAGRAITPARPRRSLRLSPAHLLPAGVSCRGSVLASLDMREGPPERALRRLDLCGYGQIAAATSRSADRDR